MSRRKKESAPLSAFSEWLALRGAEILALTNPYEILRVRLPEGIAVAYKNAKGKETWPAELTALREAHARGEQPKLGPERMKWKRKRSTIDFLAARDGFMCWYCEKGFTEESEDVTVEHIVSRAHGGPDHVSNFALACEACNKQVGHLPVVQKVAYREARRELP